MTDALRALAQAARPGRPVTRADILAIAPAVRAACDRHGRATPEVQRALLAAEAAVGMRWTEGGRRAFQALAAAGGARVRQPRVMPEDAQPYWQLGAHPLAGYRSGRRLPARADVVVIGAGLTGASTALHLAPAARAGRRIVVLEHGDPATQASGRNGGNFELMPENFLGEYMGLPAERRKWLARRYPWLQAEQIAAAAERQARLILEFGSRNARRFRGIVRREGIDCDLSASGWLRIADTPTEARGIRDEVAFAGRIGIDFEIWPPGRIRRETGVPARHLGRLAAGNGNYHPFKFVCGVLARALERGVQLFTRTPVLRLAPARDGRIRVETSAGRIDARRVVFATNAFTSRLLPELDAIRYFQSQVLNLEHVRDTIRGMTITEKKGDLYYNFPRARKYVDGAGHSRGLLLVGGGLDRPGSNPAELRRSQVVLDLVLGQTDERFPETRGQPPSRVWTGPMAFTPDRVPVIGFLRRPDTAPDALIVAAGFNGYGGTYCVEAGHLAARMALTGEVPPEVPEDMFSPQRFLTRTPMF